MKYVKEVIFILSIFVSIFSGMAKATDFYPNATDFTNLSGYCIDIYRQDGLLFSNGAKHIYINNGSSYIIPKKHPNYVKVDLYKETNKDAKGPNGHCYGAFYKQLVRLKVANNIEGLDGPNH
ncbi:hypothetical protein HLB25_20310 [Dickeya dadantii]|uniref:hypothetical protein n=1 Tax=Dickeya dadantii TaxID=204038 RepID=UPI00149613B2|nr:hypothetical protein [Dickeya dadantii]NPE57213.1 hypothetical protein [Dickeya dadantii]NPE68879.1 hypothetical protein [Dickeya dadantii]